MESVGAQKTVRLGDRVSSNPLRKSVDGERVSFVELKNLARPHLKPDSKLRYLILSEPDPVRRDQAKTMIAVYAKLLQKELRQT